MLIIFISFWPWFRDVYENVEDLKQIIDEQTAVTLPVFYSLLCNENLPNLQSNSTKIVYSSQYQQYYLLMESSLACVMIKQSGTTLLNLNPQLEVNMTITSEFIRSALINTITGDLSRIVQITISTCAIGVVLIVAIINHYSRRLAYLLSEPIDELTYSLRNIDDNNMDAYFSEMLQGNKSQHTPHEMRLLLRSLYDFIGIVKIANEAFIQGNDSQAIIGYAVANQFYLENGNILGAGVIQNNMGVIHIRNQRFTEAIICFREAIICIENEWENYKQKYAKHGINEDELIIDQEYQNLSQIVFNRCFNLCEAISEFLLTEMLELQDFLFAINTHRRSGASMESMMYAQMHMSPEVDDPNVRTRVVSILVPQAQEISTLDKLLQSKGHIRQSVMDLIRLNDAMYALRTRFLGTHDYENAIQVHDISLITENDLRYLILQLWKDAIRAYQYCKDIMELQLCSKSQRHLYITIKIIIGQLNVGSYNECDTLLQQAEIQLQACSQFEICPLSLLKQKYLLCKGTVLYKQSKFEQAANYIYQSLLVEGKFSSRDRMQALVLLKAMLNQHKIDYAPIDECLLIYQPIARDFMFVIESSRRMKQDLAMIRACRILQQLISGIQSSNDRMSMGFLNNQYNEFIPMLPKLHSQSFIDRIAHFVPRPSKQINQSQLAQIVQQYSPHYNSCKINKHLYLKKDGVAQLRYKRILVYICWDYEVQPLQDVESVVIQLSTHPNEYQGHMDIHNFSEEESGRVLAYFDQLKMESAGSNFYLEQTI